MKLTLTLVALVAVSMNLHAATPALPAPLPEFMNQDQLAKWTADQAAAASTASTASQPSTQFYTGKPYVADAGGYLFKYRTYNPEMTRWTSADPSGFPDGANNSAYLAVPTNEVDFNGLYSFSVSTTPNPLDPDTVPVGNVKDTVAFNPVTQIGLPPQTGTGSLSFTGYTFTSMSSTLSGSLVVEVSPDNYYSNKYGEQVGGEEVSAHLTSAPSLNYSWIQILTTDDGAGTTGGASGTVISTTTTNPVLTTFFDNSADTSEPFYSGTNSHGPHSATFGDPPLRGFNEVTSSFPSVSFTASTYLVSVVGNSIDVYGGFSWGFTLTKSHE